MPEMTNIRGQNFEKPKSNYHCMKCSNRIHMQKCLYCEDGSNFKPYKSIQKEGEKD
jgi:hypothetical protein